MPLGKEGFQVLTGPARPWLKQTFTKATDPQVFLPPQPVVWWARLHLAWNWDLLSLKVYGS